MKQKSVLFVDLKGYQPLPSIDVLKIVAGGAQVYRASDEEEALKYLDREKDVSLVLSNAPKLTLFTAARKSHPKTANALLTDFPMNKYSEELGAQEDKLLDHVIANRPASDWTTHELRVSVQKLIREDLFGIDKYLAPGTAVHKLLVKGSEERDAHNATVMKFAESCNLSSHMAKMIYGISEEFLMNAIYDAPLAAGKQLYQDLPRTTKILLDPTEYAEMSYGFDGQTFAIGIADPFGRLTQEKLNQYVKKILLRRDSASIIDTKKGGAGLGLFKILYSSHSLVCNVLENQRTEMIALIDTNEQLRDFAKMARSIHYFKVR